MSGQIIPVVPRRVVDFGGVTSGSTQSLVLVDKVELVHWQELTMLVRMHSNSIASGAGTISVAAQPRSFSDDDPGVTFACSAGAGPALILGSTIANGESRTGFMRTMGPNCVGDMVRIVALGNRLNTGTLNATISVDLSAKDGTSFLPNRLTSCFLWLHADDYDPTTGSWPDRSGSENHASQSSSSNRPTLETSFNGFKDVLFDGSSQYVLANIAASRLPGTGIPVLTGTDTPFSAVYLLELVALPASGLAVAPWTAGRNASANPAIESQIFNGPPVTYRTWRRDDALNFKIVGGSGAINAATKYSVADLFSGTQMSVNMNGSSYISNGDLGEGNLTLDTVCIGAEALGGTVTEFTNMRLREFALFGAVLSDIEMRAVVNGMRERADLPLL
jgi:hypothetical protein